MASNSALFVSGQDFDSIKSSFISYLQSQTAFKDYNFEGSNINVLLDILSYNTWQNSFMVNMGISEMFLDSCQTYDSAVSHAKELNYLPRSYKSAEAIVDITIVPSADAFGNYPAQIILPTGTSFVTSVDNKVYTFSLPSALIITSNGTYTATNVSLMEGNLVTEKFVVSGNTNQKYILSNSTIDTDSITVTVQDSSSSSTNTQYNYASSLLGVTANSSVYFLQGAQNGQYEIVFGDGVFGATPINGNIINVSYRVSSGTGPNGANSFKPTGTYLGGYSNYYINVTSPASGGDIAETIDSIKFRAPRHYQTQERAVTIDDYKSILMENYSEIRAIHVYGGETLSPPQYGKVIVAVDLKNVNGLPASKVNQFTSFIKSKMLLSIVPVFVSPDYTYVGVNTSIKYNINDTTSSTSDISSAVYNTINNFNYTKLDNFDITMRYSQLVAAIDNTDASIVGTNTQLMMIKKIVPSLNTNSSFALSFQNAVQSGTIDSTSFTYGSNSITCYLSDDGSGNLDVITITNGNNVIVTNNIGTINYDTGDITITNLNVSAYVGSGIKIYGTSVSQDFTCYNNTIIKILPEDTNVSVTSVRV